MRARERDRAQRLLFFTLAWSSFQAFAGIVTAVSARSVTMLGFGAAGLLDAGSTSLIMTGLWAEENTFGRSIAQLAGHRPRQLVALSRFGLAASLIIVGAAALWHGARPRRAIAGVAVTLTAVGVTYVLARAKERSAAALDHDARAADSRQSAACALLSLSALLGVGLSTFRGWWWADPLAALLMSTVLISEAQDGLRREAGTSR